MTRVSTVLCALILSLADARPAPAGGPRAADLQEVRSLLEAGRYDEADHRVAAIASEAASLDRGTSVALRQLQVEARLANGRGAETQTLAIARSLVEDHLPAPPGPRLPATASDGTNHRLLGEVLFETGEYRAALAQYASATRIHQATAGPASAEVADDLERAAHAHLWLDERQAASSAIDRAVRIAEGLARDARLARALTTRGLILHRRGLYPAARVDLTRALDIRRQVGLLHPDSVVLLSLYGDQLWFDSDLPAARSHLADAVALAERSLRAGHPAIAECLRLQANTLVDVGQIDAARNARERAVRITADAYGVDHPQYALQLHDLALSYYNTGDYGEARRLLTQALAIYRKRLGLAHSEIGSTLYNLGCVAASLGDFALAERMQRRAAASWEQSVGASHPMFAWALVALGEALSSQGRNVEALPILQRALQRRERQLGPDSIQVAATLNVLSRSLTAVKRLDRAAPLVDRAIEIWERQEAADGLAEALLIRASIAAARGDYAAARGDYERALSGRLTTLGAQHPIVGETRLALAGTLAALGQTADAFTLALDGERVTREHIRLTTGYLPERQALGYAAARARGLDVALSALVADQDAIPAFDAVVRGRSVVLDEMAMRQRLRATAARGALQPLWVALTAASKRLANLTARGAADSTPEIYAAQLERARRERVDAETALAERSSTARRELTRRDVGLEDLRTDLPDDAALVSFVRYTHISYSRTQAGSIDRHAVPTYAAFVLRGGEPSPAFIRLGTAPEVDAAVERWRSTASNGITASGGVTAGAERALRIVGASLRARIWDPLLPAIADARRVYIVPDGAINLVPFAALPTGDASYLVDAPTTIHYLSAERDLVEFDAPARARGKGLLALGGPAYGRLHSSTSSVAVGEVTQNDTAERPGNRRSSCGTLDTMLFEPLPGSRREAEDIGMLWQSLGSQAAGDAPALVLTGARAGEGEFKRFSPGHLVLHLATHGFFLGGDCDTNRASVRGVSVTVKSKTPSAAPRAAPAESPLLLSGLALAGANRRFAARPNDEDGILTAEEVAALELDGVEWAVLSACDSGLGTIVGGEGVFGLRRAFQSAGARTVIMSLWPVEDAAARTWMRALYRARLQDRLSTSEAMRQASRTVLADRRARKRSTHPFFWAGFVAAGDWR